MPYSPATMIFFVEKKYYTYYVEIHFYVKQF